MAGLIIYGSCNLFYSFMIADNVAYEATRKEFEARSKDKSSNFDLKFNKGSITLEQIEDARDKTAEIVKRLDKGEKVKVKEELSDYFN